MLNRKISRATAVALFSAASAVYAADSEWKGATSTDWFDGSNWNNGLPRGADTAIFPNNPSLTNQPLIDTADAKVGGLSIDNSGGIPYNIDGANRTLVIYGKGVSVRGPGVSTISPLVHNALGQKWEIDTGSQLTLAGRLTGIAPLVKVGEGILELNYHANNFAGGFQIDAGILQPGGTNNAAAASLRSNHLAIGSAGTVLIPGSAGGNPDTGEISGRGTFDSGTKSHFLIATADAEFAGSYRNASSSGLTMRGIGTQTFSGDTSSFVGLFSAGDGSGVTLARDAAFASGTATYFSRGGRLTLDNVGVDKDRLADTMNVDVRGGGLITLAGNAGGSKEIIGTVIMNSGALNIAVAHNAGATGTTILTINGVNRAGSQATINFRGKGMGESAVGAPQVLFAQPLPFINGSNETLLVNDVIGHRETGSSFPPAVGFAIVHDADFATYDNATGVKAVSTTAFPQVFGGDPTANALLSGNDDTALSPTKFAVNTLKLQGSGTLNINSAGDLAAGGILLTGPTTFRIASTGLGKLAGDATRYIHVTDPDGLLRINADVAGEGPGDGVTPIVNPITKAGAGTLSLEGTTFISLTATNAINVNILEGTLRATNAALPPDRTIVRFRGGVFELDGGGLINRQVGVGANPAGSVNWRAGTSSSDTGSGGFSARGGSAVVDLNTLGTRDNFNFGSSNSFVGDGYALIFGSRTADSTIEFFDNLNLSFAVSPTAVENFYGYREIRVIDNPASNGDKAVISGVISSALLSLGGHNTDLFKTGDGILELTNDNTYVGNTLVAAGTLRSLKSMASAAYILQGGRYLPEGGVPVGSNVLVKGGNVTFSVPLTRLDTVIATSGSAVVATSPSPNQKVLVAKSISVSGAGKIDLANNAAVLDYDAGDAPVIASVRSMLAAGYNGGAWNGNGLTTSAGSANRSIGYGEASVVLGGGGGNWFGYPADGNAILMRYTIAGDITLDGAVTFADLIQVAANFGQFNGTAVWTLGDVNYDAQISFVDLLTVAANFGGPFPSSAELAALDSQTAGLIETALASVPEPSLLAWAGLAGAVLMRRRRAR